MDVVNTGLNKYRIFVDIHLLSKPNSIEEYNYNFNSRSTYLYIEKYVDYKNNLQDMETSITNLQICPKVIVKLKSFR